MLSYYFEKTQENDYTPQLINTNFVSTVKIKYDRSQIIPFQLLGVFLTCNDVEINTMIIVIA